MPKHIRRHESDVAMAFKTVPATIEHDEGVTALFTAAGVPIEPQYWERAYSVDNPENANSQPYVAVDHEGVVLGFIASRPIQLFIEGQYAPARVIHDFVVTDDPVQRDVAGLLLKDAQEGGEVTLACGTGIAASKIVQQNSFQRAGEFFRLLYNPSDRDDQRKKHVPPMQLAAAESFPPDIENLLNALAAERRIFRQRTTANLNWMFRGPAREYEIWTSAGPSGCEAYAVLHRTEGRHGPELHLVDALCPNVDIKRLALGLVEIARARQLPLYVSLFARNWEEQFLEMGFHALRARWPLFWMLRDPRQRIIGGALLRGDAWFFSPADAELDHW